MATHVIRRIVCASAKVHVLLTLVNERRGMQRGRRQYYECDVVYAEVAARAFEAFSAKSILCDEDCFARVTCWSVCEV